MLKILEKLNNPQVVVTVLAVILLANGYLLYYQWNANSAPPDDASANETVSENESRPEVTRQETTVSDPPEETTEIEETTSEETTSEETTSSKDNESNEKNSVPSDESKDKKPKDDSNRKDSESNDSDKNKDRSDRDVPVLAGLEEFVRGCDAGVEKCIRNYVSKESPKSKYVAGRTDLGSEKKNVEVLYFEVPDLAPCEYERELYKTKDGREYTVIVLGPGSFSDERADECIPQA